MQSEAVERTIGPVVDDTSGQAMDLLGAVPGHAVGREGLAGEIKGAAVQIDDAQVLAQRLFPVRVLGELAGAGAKGVVRFVIGLDLWLHHALNVERNQIRIAVILGRLGDRGIVGVGTGRYMLANDVATREAAPLGNRVATRECSRIGGLLPGLEVVIGQANEGGDEDNDADDEAGRLVGSYLSEHYCMLRWGTKRGELEGDEGTEMRERVNAV